MKILTCLMLITLLAGCNSLPDNNEKIKIPKQEPWPASASTPLIMTGAINYAITN